VVHLPEKRKNVLLIPFSSDESFPAFPALGQMVSGASGGARRELSMQKSLELLFIEVHQASS
jgi:hypothetical protein